MINFHRRRKMISKIRELFISTKKFGNDIVDLFQPKNSVKILFKNPDTGEVTKTIKGRNIVTSWFSADTSTPCSGKDVMRRLLMNPTLSGSGSLNNVAYVAFMEVGSGTSVENVTDTALAGSLFGTTTEARKAVTVSTLTTSGNMEITFVSTWEAGDQIDGQTLGEVSLLSNRNPNDAQTASGGPDLIARKTFTPFEKTNEFDIEIQWTLRF